MQYLQIWYCRRGDSNPHELPHTPLKRARLPVPPLRLALLDDCHAENSSRGDAVTTDCNLGHEEKATSSSFPDLPLASHQSTTLHLYPEKNCCSGKQPPKVTQRSRERLLPQAKAAAPAMARLRARLTAARNVNP